MFFLFLESLGTTELLVILVAALVLFGPRKLPQLSRSLGKSIGEFKRASEEFKKTWEKEVSMEETERDARIAQAMLPQDNSILASTVERGRAVHEMSGDDKDLAAPAICEVSPSELAVDAPDAQSAVISQDDATAPASSATTLASEPMSKRDWL